MMVRRIGRHILISFDYQKQARSFFDFMKKRDNDAIFLEGEGNIETD
jgi:hypothetical protein